MLKFLVMTDDTTDDPKMSFTTAELAEAQAAIRVKKAAERKREVEEAMIQLLGKHDMARKSAVASIREARKIIACQQKKLREMDFAMQYTDETGNVIPWAKTLGFTSYHFNISQEEFERLSKIPEGWKPKS